MFLTIDERLELFGTLQRLRSAPPASEDGAVASAAAVADDTGGESESERAGEEESACKRRRISGNFVYMSQSRRHSSFGGAALRDAAPALADAADERGGADESADAKTDWAAEVMRSTAA